MRAFHRFYTGAIGVFGERHLDSGLTLGQARLLFEIDQLAPVEMKTLRVHLRLDRGLLSRQLATLSEARLVRTAPARRDRRIKRVTLTSAGRRKLDLINRRSDLSVAKRIGDLDARARHRLVAALDEIQALLSHVDIVSRPADGPDSAACLAAYVAELERRFPGGFDPRAAAPPDPDETRPPRGDFLVMMIDGRPRGCGAVRALDPGVAEIKRMWVHPAARGRGLGRRLLDALEARAAALGFRRVRLDTSAYLVEALALYRACGYRAIARYNDNPYAAHWMEKRLTRRRG